MGDFTKAVFDSKTIFEDEVLEKFEHCNFRLAKLQFVNKNIPESLTKFTENIKKKAKDQVNQSFQEDSDNIKPSKTPALFTPHPRFPVFSNKVGVR